MKTITAIEAQRKGKDRVNVFLDGGFGFSLAAAVLAERGLHTGQVLSDSELEELGREDLFRRCLNSAFRLLSYRPRSEVEMRTRLRRRFDEETVARVLHHLKASQMIDDAAFAQFWRENREYFSPRSKRLLKLELRGKGVDAELVGEVVAGMDEEESALRAARRRARLWAGEDYETFRRNLGAFLRRRGFGYEVVSRTIERLWQE